MAVALAAAVLLGGCATGGSSTQHASGRIVHVSERDFRITAPRTLPPGPVRLIVHNHGPDTHELLVVRLIDPNLPLRGDGLTINEDAIAPETVGNLEPGQPGATRELDVTLKPGTYELFCNMSGHFMGGMHTLITVG
ncbi:MAG TPA: hypothetical protein VFQ71_08320 [Gaiellales bacterium]|nr:hypothetical protein [Gaiellales bacterium]